MAKLKNLLIILIGGFFVMLLIDNSCKRNKIVELEQDNIRLGQNQVELMTENNKQKNLILTRDEFIKSMDDSLKQALKELKIKPKTITKIEERVIIQKEYDTVRVPVYLIKKDQWVIKDTGQCFTWHGIAELTDDSLNVKRTYFSYQNKTTDIFNKQPKRKLFGFIPIGKKIVWTQRSDCGEPPTVKVIEIMK